MTETKTQVKPKGPASLSGLYQWRDRQGQFHHPGEMETRHLFHTVSMIWNHTMPVKTRPNYRQYKFSPYYTEQYMKLSIVMLVHELFRRDDLLPEWKATLDMMWSYVRKPERLIK